MPKSVEIRTEPLPLSGALKVLKKDLRAPYWAGHERARQLARTVSVRSSTQPQIVGAVHVLFVVVVGRGRVGAEVQPAYVDGHGARPPAVLRRRRTTCRRRTARPRARRPAARAPRRTSGGAACGRRPTPTRPSMSTVPVSPAASIASARSQSQLEQIASVSPRSRSSASTADGLVVRAHRAVRADLADARDELVLVVGRHAALVEHPADAGLLPGDVVVTRLRVLVVLDAVDAVVPPAVAHVGGELVADLGDHLLPRRSPVGRLGERAVEVEDDSFHWSVGQTPTAARIVGDRRVVGAVGVDVLYRT